MTRTRFDSEEVAQAYAERLRSGARASNRTLPGFTYRVLDTPPTAGDASFWDDHTALVFRRRNSVVVLGAAQNDRAQLAAGRAIIQELARRVDDRLVGESATGPLDGSGTAPQKGDTTDEAVEQRGTWDPASNRP